MMHALGGMTPKPASTFALYATIGHEAIPRVPPKTGLSDWDAEFLTRRASGVNPVSIKPGQVHYLLSWPAPEMGAAALSVNFLNHFYPCL